MNSLLEVNGLSKSFGTRAGKLEVLKGIDLRVAAGETIALVGASGAGKSTLLHVLGTIDTPTSGTVQFNGGAIFKLGGAGLAAFRNCAIGFVFQFHHLLPEFSALENTMMPLLIGGIKRGEA